MPRKIIVIIFIFVCFILQSSVFGNLAFNGIIPNLLIILTSSFGFMRGEEEGMIIGFICGLLCDVFFGSILGFYALIYMYIGFLNGKFSMIFLSGGYQAAVSSNYHQRHILRCDLLLFDVSFERAF